MTRVAGQRHDLSGIAAFCVNDGVKPSTLEAEAEHLRRLLDRQPCCLLRVGLDDMLLAANDVALQELGARDLEQALDRPFTNWIVPDDHELWHEFVTEVRERGAGDQECDLVSLDGAQHEVLLKGVVLADHPDGIASVLLVMRDISGTRRLEEALQEHARTRQALADLRQRLESALAEQQGVRKAIEERDANNRRLLAERSQLQEQLNVLQSKLAGAAAEHVRLEDLLEEQERRRKALVATHSAERAEAERALAAASMEREQALKELADQRAQLHSLDENTRRLEPLASAGRLALEVAHELQCRVAAVSAGARSLLPRCSETSPDRQQIEALLGETDRAASLARQFVLRGIDPVENPIPHDVASGAVDQPYDSGRTS